MRKTQQYKKVSPPVRVGMLVDWYNNIGVVHNHINHSSIIVKSQLCISLWYGAVV